MLNEWARRDFRNLVRYCRLAEAFQDIPFSYPDTYRAMDAAFPGSKFILTMRGDGDEWFDSLVRFQTKIIGKKRVPTADDLREFKYRYPGFLWDAHRLRYGADEKTLYDRDLYVRCYEEHNKQVIEYFQERPTDLLVINVKMPDAMQRLLNFLGYPHSGETMPHQNASLKTPLSNS